MIARDPVTVLVDCASLLPRTTPGYQRLLNIAEMVERGTYSREDAERITGYGMHTQAGYTPDERAAFALVREGLAPGAGVEVSR